MTVDVQTPPAPAQPRFPGPVFLPLARKWRLGFASFAAAAVASALWGLGDGPEGSLAWAITALGLAIGACSAACALPGSAGLHLTAAGFTTVSFYLRTNVAWADLRGVSAMSAGSMGRVAAFEFVRGGKKQVGTLPRVEGHTPEQLAELVRLWAARGRAAAALVVQPTPRPDPVAAERARAEQKRHAGQRSQEIYARAAGLPLWDSAYALWKEVQTLNAAELPPGLPDDLSTFAGVQRGVQRAILSLREAAENADSGPTFGRLQRVHPDASETQLRHAIRAAVKFRKDCIKHYDSAAAYPASCDRAVAIAFAENPGFSEVTRRAAAAQLVHEMR